jgi:hypothetical protein
MKVVIYVNTDELSVGDDFPRVLTEKQYEEMVNTMVAEKMDMDNLAKDDDFDDWLGFQPNRLADIFFISQEEKNRLLKEFEERVRVSAYEELEDYYEKFEIEI